MLQLHKEELAVHGNALKDVSIWKDQLSSELESALTEAMKNTHDVVLRE
jgi:hypothetical protein